ncbi:MAG: DUF368 domain-containing protein [Planctomycetota bacterium]
MTEPTATEQPPAAVADEQPIGTLTLRALFGGVLMGLANLVPGISGGTMLLASGIYHLFIDAIAEVTTFKFRPRSLLVLGCVIVAAIAAIVLLAGVVVSAVVEARWVMYSLFIGLTLGGLPLVWRMARPATPAVWIGAGCGVLVMGAVAIAQMRGSGTDSGAGSSLVMLFIAGIAGASAMILPGVSGGYLLLVLGQYVPILASVDRLKDAAGARDLGAMLGEWRVVIPVGFGVLAGVVGVSNLLRWLLHRYEKATLGVLLGLLVGAILGLWPFQAGQQPQIGDTFKGEVVTAESIEQIEPQDWPTSTFTPSILQIGGSLGLIVVGFGLTVAVDRFGAGRKSSP